MSHQYPVRLQRRVDGIEEYPWTETKSQRTGGALSQPGVRKSGRLCVSMRWRPLVRRFSGFRIEFVFFTNWLPGMDWLVSLGASPHALTRMPISAALRRTDEAISVARPAERAKLILVALNQRLLLGPGPALELCFARARGGKGGKYFNAKDCCRRIQRGSPAGLAGSMVLESLFEIRRGAEVDDPRTKA